MAPSNRPSKAAIVSALALSFWFATVAPASAQVGLRNFLQPIFTQDADPSNDLGLTPVFNRTVGTNIYSLGISVEKQLSNDLSVQLTSAWNAPKCENSLTCSPASENRHGHRIKSQSNGLSLVPSIGTGWDNLSILVKWAIAESAFHEFRLAVGAQALLGTGNLRAGASSRNYLGPIAMLSKGMGDLPDALGFLRPFALQVDTGLAEGLNLPTYNGIFGDAMISYQLYYLADNVLHHPLPWPLGYLAPFSEFTYSGTFGHVGAGVVPDLRAYPGLAWQQGAYQVSVAAMFAMNTATMPAEHGGVIGLFDVALDQLDSRFGWTAF